MLIDDEVQNGVRGRVGSHCCDVPQQALQHLVVLVPFLPLPAGQDPFLAQEPSGERRWTADTEQHRGISVKRLVYTV